VIIASEVASRTLRSFVCDGRGGGFHVPNADYGWTHRPGARVESHGCVGRRYEFSVTVETNSKGLCDKEYAYQPAPGAARVVVLGDSVVEAAQVRRDQAFAKILEQRWSAAPVPVEVINMGVAGFSTDNQLLMYGSESRKYSPDLVVSEFNLENDVGELSPAIHRRECTGPQALPTADVTLDENGEVRIDTAEFRVFAAEGARRQASTDYLDFWLSRNLYLYRRISGVFADQREAAGPGRAASEPFFPGLGMYLEPAPPEWEDAWKLTAATYRRFAREVAADGARLVVAILPSKEVVAEERWRWLLQWVVGAPPPGRKWDREAPRRRIVAILSELGIPFVDVTDAMRDAFAKSGNTGFFDFDPHPTADGHRVIADALAPYLSEQLEVARSRR